jgi:hypothetical protein
MFEWCFHKTPFGHGGVPDGSFLDDAVPGHEPIKSIASVFAEPLVMEEPES